VADEGGEYDLKYRLYKKYPAKLKKPFKIEIEHSTVCNKKCTFCMHTHWDERQEQMPFEKYKKIVDDIPSLKWINIAGIGSPFLHKDFIPMLQYARDKDINTNFVDEFDMFDLDRARQIIEMGINSIYVSFDAAKKETYEEMKKGCNFEKSLGNIKALLNLKAEMKSPFPVLHFRFLITRSNYLEMADYIDLVASLPNRGDRARVEFIGLITFPGIEDSYISLNEIPEDLKKEVYERALKHKINLYFSHSDSSCLPSMTHCVRWSEPFVLVNGEVISDCAILMQNRRDELNDISLGNAFDKPFMELWNSKRYSEFRNNVVCDNAKVPHSCLKCCTFDVNERKEKYGVTQEFLNPKG
jgi:MoaA/NifB/PqqE/SkfB family radical SAM enzyme